MPAGSINLASHYEAADQLERFDMIELDRELVKQGGMREYMEAGWHVMEPSRPYVPNFHGDAICEHLDAVRAGEISNLAMTVPPGTGKSLSVLVGFPTFLWTDYPGAKIVSAAYGDVIATRDAWRSQIMLESAWWQARWGQQMHPQKNMWGKQHYRNKEGGFRFATTVGGVVVGEHGHVQLIDDPHKPLEVGGKMHVAQAALDRVELWDRETMSTRYVDGWIQARVLIMQRLHRGDMAGLALKDSSCVHLCLPMEYVPRVMIEGADLPECGVRDCEAQHWPNVDPRTEPGELLDPVRFPAEKVAILKEKLGPKGVASQLQQQPSPVEGQIFKQTMVQYYRRADLPKMRRLIQSWDMKAKKQGRSYVSGQVWGQKGLDVYLLDRRHGRWGITDTKQNVRELSANWPQCRKILIEDKANGPAVIEEMSHELYGLTPVEPKGDKFSRAEAVEPMWASMRVWLPHTDECSWIAEWLREVLDFPDVINDDDVDAMTQALEYLKGYTLAKYAAAVKNMQG